MKVGDRVKIVLYGHIELDYNNEGGLSPKDIMPSLVGKEGIIDRVVGNRFYIKGTPPKYGPYNLEQLEVIHDNVPETERREPETEGRKSGAKTEANSTSNKGTNS